VSHELRTPLTAIAGSLGLVGSGAAGELPPKAHRLIEVARRNSDGLKRLVDDLLDLDKLQSGQMTMHAADVDLRTALKEALEQNLPFAERHGARLRLHVPPHPVIARIDSGRIGQVITNLLPNGVKFSPKWADISRPKRVLAAPALNEGRA
jgi:signal transduction histidine kinase